MLRMHHPAQSLDPRSGDWKSTFLRPVTGWNLSFEDNKSSTLAMVRVTLPKNRGHARIEHPELGEKTSVNLLLS